jgi:hypothetical protein
VDETALLTTWLNMRRSVDTHGRPPSALGRRLL